jgi:Putative restriction endonuclease
VPNEKRGVGGSLGAMPTLVFDPQPAEIEELLARRRDLGIDRWDEVWEGVLHMIPPPSHKHQLLASRLHRLLGPLADEAGLELTADVGVGSDEHNYRAPDLALHRPADVEPQWHRTAAVAVEIVSPNDKTWDKLGFYAAHHVDELVIMDPDQRTVHWLALLEGQYQPLARSGLIELGPSELAKRIDWP